MKWVVGMKSIGPGKTLYLAYRCRNLGPRYLRLRMSLLTIIDDLCSSNTSAKSQNMDYTEVSSSKGFRGIPES
jgi:hypothetical protein